MLKRILSKHTEARCWLARSRRNPALKAPV